MSVARVLVGVMAAVTACALSTLGCSGGDRGGGERRSGAASGRNQGGMEFESDLPVRDEESPDGTKLDFMGMRAAEGGAESTRAILEADVIQLSGGLLYALSRASGLAVVDLSNPSQPRLLGRYRELPGQPFEMYLRGDVILMMFSGWSEYVRADDGSYALAQTSRVVALDAREPSAIARVGEFEVPGSIQDSRIVGDVLYIASLESGSCYRCGAEPATTISSIDVSDPSAIRTVDALRYVDATGDRSWRRSISVTEHRMYVAGPEYGRAGPTGSTIQVVDISDPGGRLVEGAVLQARGQISSRWQMDEHDGVLRIVSRALGEDASTDPPRVQTFRVISSREFRALGETALVVPPRDTLRSVRFDGPRAYVVTAEITDPLIMVDLSDPAHPRQAGELKLPGFIEHLEPRGDRLLGLGYDRDNPEGEIALSLFDVADLARPQLLSRVNFGDRAQLPEDQDRLQKVLRVLPEHGLILVPFSEADPANCAAGPRGSVQVVDYPATQDRLARRGTAAVRTRVRRAFTQAEHLIAVGDHQVDVFELAERGDPRALGRVVLAAPVADAKALEGGVVARLVDEYPLTPPRIELAPAETAEDPNALLGTVEIGEWLPPEMNRCESMLRVRSIHARGSRLFVHYDRAVIAGNAASDSGILTIDAADPRAPRVQPGPTWTREERSSFSYWRNGSFGSGTSTVWRGATLAILEELHEPGEGGYDQPRLRLRLVDMRDESSPVLSTIELPRGRPYSGLVARGDELMLAWVDASEDEEPARAPFYVQSVDASDPGNPRLLPRINLPGAVVYADPNSGRVLTSELTRVEAGSQTRRECGERFAQLVFEGGPNPDDVGECDGLRQSIHLVELSDGQAEIVSTVELEDHERISAWSAGDGLLFTAIRGPFESTGFGGLNGGCGSTCSADALRPVEVMTAGDFDADELTSGRVIVEVESVAWSAPWEAPALFAHGRSALLASRVEAAIVDGEDPTAPTIARVEPLRGPVKTVHFDETSALLSMGRSGMQSLDYRP
jgi:hypothetical protein